MSSPALKSLVEFLTRPLLFTEQPVAALQQALYTALAPYFPLPYTFTFRLSPSLQTPTTIYNAAVASGVSWEGWIAALGSGAEVEICVSPSSVAACVSGGIEMTIWKQDMVPISRLQRTRMARQLLDSVRSRREAASEHCTAASIRVPTLYGGDSDTESDDTGSVFAFSDRGSSATVVTTAPPSPASEVCDLPVVEVTPVIGTTPAELTRYLYQGGSTGVVGGGVMLGAATAKKAPSPKRSAAPKVLETKPAPSMGMKAPVRKNTNGQWRRSPASSEGNWRVRRANANVKA